MPQPTTWCSQPKTAASFTRTVSSGPERKGGTGALTRAGTAEETYYHRAQTQTTGGTPAFPYGLYIRGDADPREVNLNVGSGTPGVQLQHFPVVYPTLGSPAPGTYAACNQEVPYYHGRRFTTVRFVPAGAGALPEGCVAITLVAQCATLPELPKGSLASYKFASVVNCYDNVASIKWSEYGP